MEGPEYEEFVARAIAYLEERNDSSRATFSLDSFDRYDVDQETATITFSEGPGASVVADIQAVGTWAYQRSSWRWAWSNPSIDPNLVEASNRVRSFGQQRGIEELTQPAWEADEGDAWTMVALTAYLSRAEGAYRCPDAPSYFFVVYFNMRWKETTDAS